MNYLEPEDYHTCPTCNGDGWISQILSACDPCPFDNRDCKECISAGDNCLDDGRECDTCCGCGEISESQWKQILREDYADHLADVFADLHKNIKLQLTT